MDKIFAKTLKPSFFGPFWAIHDHFLSPLTHLNFFSKTISLCLTLCLTSQKKKSEKTDDLEILHCRWMEIQTKTNLQDTSARVGFQLVFAPCRHGLSVAVWWYILVRFWVKLFLSQGLIQVVTTVNRKAATQSKGHKDGNKVKIKLE